MKAVIKDDAGKMLLGREKGGFWELPGGGLEHGENTREALAREIEEETGFTLEWVSEQPVAFWTINKDVGSPTLTWFAFIVYEAKASGTFKPGADMYDEVEEVRYVSREEARLLNLHDNTKPFFA